MTIQPRAATGTDRGPAFSPELQGLMTLVGRALGLSSEVFPAPALETWNRLLELAARHRVMPLVHSGLRNSPEIFVPAIIRDRLALQTDFLWRRFLILSQELGRISQLLADNAIAMAAMKGPGLNAQAYGSGSSDAGGIRAMRDLDILIRREDFRRTQAVLESYGFACEEAVSRLSGPLQDLYLGRATHISFQHSVLGYCLEVHLRPMQAASLFPLSTETLLASARPISLGGSAVPVLAPRHHFLYVAAHGAKHGWWRLLWLADFVAFQRILPERPPLEADNDVSERVCERGLRRVLATASLLCHLCFGSPLPSQSFLGKPVSSQTVHARVAHGRRCLERGGPPVHYKEKWDELYHLLNLRPETAYRWDVVRLYWDLTPADLAAFHRFLSCPATQCLPVSVLASLAPALRPVLWATRRLPAVILRKRVPKL